MCYSSLWTKKNDHSQGYKVSVTSMAHDNYTLYCREEGLKWILRVASKTGHIRSHSRMLNNRNNWRSYFFGSCMNTLNILNFHADAGVITLMHSGNLVQQHSAANVLHFHLSIFTTRSFRALGFEKRFLNQNDPLLYCRCVFCTSPQSLTVCI